MGFLRVSILLLVCVPASRALAAAEQDEVRALVDRLVEPYLQTPSFVGLVVGVVKDGERHVFAYGETAKGSGTAPDGDTLYEIGSITKVFTGILLADAIEHGLVTLEDPVQEHLPADVVMPMFEEQPLQLVHLATHTSGLPRMPDNLQLSDPFDPFKGYTPELLYQFLGKHRLRRGPDEMEYSNLGMGLLGHVLALKSETPYEALVRKRICEPLAMNDTVITLDEGQQQRLAPPYNGFFFQVKNWELASLAGAGGLRSTVNDMLNFIEAQFRDDDQSLTRALQGARTVHHSRDDGIDVGLAWHRAKDQITWLHDGRTGGYSSYVAVTPSRRLGIVLLANRATAAAPKLGVKLLEALFAEESAE